MALTRYEPCPYCNSKDNVGVFLDDDGVTRKWCFSCNDRVDSTGQKITWPIPGFTVSAIPERGILKDTCAKYGVARRGQVVVFPSPNRTGYKLRDHNFPKWERALHMSISGVYDRMFGIDTIHTKNIVAIAGGEYDALSVYQVTGIPCLAPPNGDGSLARSVKKDWKLIDGIEKIVYLPDQDKAGQESLAKLRELLGEDRVHVAQLTHKDCNEYLLANEGHLLKQAFWSARPDTNLFYDSYDGMIKQTQMGLLTGIEPLDKLLLGLRQGEVTYVLGAPGMGKTTFTTYLTWCLANQGLKVGLVSLEGGHRSLVTKMAHMFLGGNVHLLSEEDKAVLLSVMKENTELARLHGIVQPDDIKRAIRAAVKARDCRVIIFDNLTSAGDPAKLFESSSQLVVQLNSLAEELGVHIVVISHIGRQFYNEPPTIGSATGTGNIERFSFNMLGVFTEKTQNRTRFEVIKSREVGEHGIFYGTLDKNTLRYSFSVVTTKDEWTYAGRKARSQQ